MLNEIFWTQTNARLSTRVHKLLELIKWSVIFSFHHHLKCLLSSHVILPPHFTLGIELRACELNQIYKGQRSKNRIVIDFSLYQKLDVATIMSNTLGVSILIWFPREQITQLLLLHHAKFAHSDFIGTIQAVNQLQKRIFRVPISEALEMARSAAVCTAGTAAQGSWPMLLQQKYPQVQSWWAAGVCP